MNRLQSIDLTALRERLAGTSGPAYWRSLEELAETDEFREMVQAEFPEHASEWTDSLSRRRFLTLMGASLGLAGLTGCIRQPLETIVPYLQAPEQLIPGKPLYFATAMNLGGFAMGLLAESHMGRPTKVEGNPQHPSSLGATDTLAQASILQLYDPDRSQVVTQQGQISSWKALLSQLESLFGDEKTRPGLDVRVLTETVTSPALAAQMKRLGERFPKLRWHQYDSVDADWAREGARLAFGQDVEPLYNLSVADLVVSFDSDFLGTGPGRVRQARDYGTRRARNEDPADLSRVYMAECSPTVSGAAAEHRLPVTPSRIVPLAVALLDAVTAGSDARRRSLSADERQWVEVLAEELVDPVRRGKSLLLAGDQQPPIVHWICHFLNRRLENIGRTVQYLQPLVTDSTSRVDSISELTRDLTAGKVDVLILMGGNPVVDAPSDLGFGEALKSAGTRIRLGLYSDETSRLCQWHVPETHFLESWGDSRGHDGTVTLQQPLILPLYDSKSPLELLSALLGESGRTAEVVLREYWKGQTEPANFDRYWRAALHDGFIPDSGVLPAEVEARDPTGSLPSDLARPGGSLELVLRPDPSVYDGRFANNAWLQELPRPLTKLTWDNAALVAPSLAEAEYLQNGDMVSLRVDGRTIDAGIWIVPGHPARSVTVHLGYGRIEAGRVGNGVGFDVSPLRTTRARWSSPGLEMKKTGAAHSFACTQTHQSMEGRNLVRIDEAGEHHGHNEGHGSNGGHGGHGASEVPSFFPPHAGTEYAWGMTIDLKSCIGCNACVVACQAENNIPTVGKTEVARGREMHWLRIDRYYKGELENPMTVHQPVPCMHCEEAPCEVVCPVGATVHSDEGLNDMVYNRCVGTRYCSNNCPYKVRRFNFFDYSDYETESLKLGRNPDVTVRTRGVMEKCTYCVQRINVARIESGKEDRKIADGEIQTACQTSCPTQAIVFGNVNDKLSRVSRLKASERNYSLLEGLGTRPRTTYLSGARNLNPKMRKQG